LQGGPEANVYILPTQMDDKIFAYFLSDGNSKVLVLLNFSPSDKQRFTVGHAELAGAYNNIISGLAYNFNQQESFELQAWEFAVYGSTSL
jgi:Zn-dependent peptidase ImmA (M78 family)